MNERNLAIGFIGGGNMASAIIGGLLNSDHPAARIVVAEPDEGRRAKLQSIAEDLQVTTDNAAAAADADVLVLAVKPQMLPGVAAELGPAPRPERQVVVSVAAGIGLATLGGWFGTDGPIVRVMPNQPALAGAGMTVLTASAATDAQQRQRAQYIAEAVGLAVWLDDEQSMDAVTAISGSGPAYFYLLIEMLEDCARDLGLEAGLAATLARQTAYGAGVSARDASSRAAELRAIVTSPGGTTEAAIAQLEQSGIRDIFRTALRAARDRSRELGQSSEKR